MAGRHSDFFYENSWWSAEQICREWKREQVEWLLYYLPEVLRGHWPKDPDSATGYVDPQIYKPKRREYKAIMEGIIATGALLEKRLFHCKMGGLLAEANITWGKSIESLAKVAGMSEEEVIERIDSAIEYVVSYGRKPK